jgi:hypothetical protein
VIPAGDAEHQICVGYLFGIHYNAFAFESIGPIASGFGNGALVDPGQCGQNYIVLVICHWIQIATVGVLAEMYLF